MQKLALTVTDIDVVGGELIPVTTLIQSDFKFIKASDNVTEVAFTGFSNQGNGNYLFWGFDVDVFDPVTNPSFAREQVRIKINNVFQDGYGTFSVYHDDDEPPSASYSIGRVDRQGDTVFYWLTYVPDDEHSPPFNPYDPDSAADPDNVLVCNKYVKDNFGLLAGSNTGDKRWTGANEHFFTPIMATDSTEYIVGIPAYDNSLVWRGWVEANFGGIGNNSWPINTDRLIVDSKQTSNITGKVYNTISAALTYAATIASVTRRISIFVFPHTSTGYSENITLPRYVNLIGVGNVVINGSFSVISPGSWTGYDSSLHNLWIKAQNLNILLDTLKCSNCIFWCNGASGEVNLQVDGCEMFNCGFYVQNDVSIEIANTVKINRIVNCYGNTDITWLGTDKVYSYNYVTGDLIEF